MGARSLAPTRLRVSGDTIRCRGQRQTTCQGRTATAASVAASRRFSRAPAWYTHIDEVGGNGDDAHVIAAAAAGGDPCAAAAVERYATRLARALAGVINILDPNVIVLGGGLSNIDVLYTRVPALWGEWVFSDRVDTTLVPARHGDSSGVRGAAWLWEK